MTRTNEKQEKHVSLSRLQVILNGPSVKVSMHGCEEWFCYSYFDSSDKCHVVFSLIVCSVEHSPLWSETVRVFAIPGSSGAVRAVGLQRI